MLKVEQGSEVLAFVTADIDRESFSADHLSSWHILPDGLLRHQGATGLNRKDDTFTKFIMGAEFPARVEYYPFHVYNFDFTSLNFVFRHLVDPEQSFEIGVVDPDWKRILSPEFELAGLQRRVFVFKGRARIDYVGDEPCNGTLCRKYRIGGPGMGDQKRLHLGRPGAWPIRPLRASAARQSGLEQFPWWCADCGSSGLPLKEILPMQVFSKRTPSGAACSTAVPA